MKIRQYLLPSNGVDSTKADHFSTMERQVDNESDPTQCHRHHDSRVVQLQYMHRCVNYPTHAAESQLASVCNRSLGSPQTQNVKFAVIDFICSRNNTTDRMKAALSLRIESEKESNFTIALPVAADDVLNVHLRGVRKPTETTLQGVARVTAHTSL